MYGVLQPANLVSNCELLAGLGDHDAVSIKNSLFVKKKKPSKRKILLWNRADVNKIKEKTNAFRNTFLKKFSTRSNVNEMWEYIKKNLKHYRTPCSLQNDLLQNISALDQQRLKIKCN